MTENVNQYREDLRRGGAEQALRNVGWSCQRCICCCHQVQSNGDQKPGQGVQERVPMQALASPVLAPQ